MDEAFSTDMSGHSSARFHGDGWLAERMGIHEVLMISVDGKLFSQRECFMR
jgi:hypothetical protein